MLIKDRENFFHETMSGIAETMVGNFITWPSGKQELFPAPI